MLVEEAMVLGGISNDVEVTVRFGTVVAKVAGADDTLEYNDEVDTPENVQREKFSSSGNRDDKSKGFAPVMVDDSR